MVQLTDFETSMTLYCITWSFRDGRKADQPYKFSLVCPTLCFHDYTISLLIETLARSEQKSYCLDADLNYVPMASRPFWMRGSSQYTLESTFSSVDSRFNKLLGLRIPLHFSEYSIGDELIFTTQSTRSQQLPNCVRYYHPVIFLFVSQRVSRGSVAKSGLTRNV